MDLASLEGNDLDRFIGLALFPFIRELIRLEIEDTFYLSSALFSDIAFNLTICFGYDVVGACKSAFSAYLPAHVGAPEILANGGALFFAEQLTAFFSAIKLADLLQFALFAPLSDVGQAVTCRLYAADLLNQILFYLNVTQEEAVAATLNATELFGTLLLAENTPTDKLAAALANPSLISAEIAEFLDAPVVEVWARLPSAAFPNL